MTGKASFVGPDACTLRVIDSVRVAKTRDRLISCEEAGQLAGSFRLLGDATRCRILFALLEAEELCVCDLAASVEVPENAVSQSLRLLRTAGVVVARRAGRMVLYRLDDHRIRQLLALSREHLRGASRDS